MDLITATLVMFLVSALLTPLLYALGTLLGMREKAMYPLLRCKGANGRLSPVVVARTRLVESRTDSRAEVIKTLI